MTINSAMNNNPDHSRRPTGRYNALLAPLRGRMILYVVLLVVAVVVMAMIRNCSTPSPFKRESLINSGSDTLDVAIEYGPMTLYRYADTLGGPAYDMIRDMMSRAGVPIKFHPVTSAGTAIGLLHDGSVDIVVAEMPRIADNDSLTRFTEPVYLDRQVLVQRLDSAGNKEVNSALDLAGRRVTVVSGSPMYHRLRNLSSEIGDTIIIESDSIHGAEQIVIMTALGEIDLSVVNSRVATSVASDYPDLDISTAISFTQFQSWLMRSDDTLIVRIDSIIRNYRETPAYKSISIRYGL